MHDRNLRKVAAQRMADDIMRPYVEQSEDELFWLLSLQVAHQNNDVDGVLEACQKLSELGIVVVRAKRPARESRAEAIAKPNRRRPSPEEIAASRCPDRVIFRADSASSSAAAANPAGSGVPLNTVAAEAPLTTEGVAGE